MTKVHCPPDHMNLTIYRSCDDRWIRLREWCLCGPIDLNGCSHASTALACIQLGTRAAVVASRAVRGVGIRTLSSCGVACAGDMTLVQGNASYGVRTDAVPVLARVRLRAGVAVVASDAVIGVGIGALPRSGIADSSSMTLVLSQASYRGTPDASTVLACVWLSAAVTVAACRTARGVRIRALASSGIAGAHHMTLVQRGADDGAGPNASAVLAYVRLRAGVAVVASNTVVRDWIRALASSGIADPRYVALV